MKTLILTLLFLFSLNANAWVCKTYSNGNSFSFESTDFKIAKRIALEQCQMHAETNAKECSEFVDCINAAAYEAKYTCETFSNSHVFSAKRVDAEIAKRQAISACVDYKDSFFSDSISNRKECEKFYECRHDEDLQNSIKCTLQFTNQQKFEATAWTARVAYDYVISLCKDVWGKRCENSELITCE